jgi:Zn-dependent peptidase ImmA (M78 family)
MSVLAKAAARKIISYYGITEPNDIDVSAIAVDRNLLILDKNIDGSQGRLICRGENGIITIDSKIQTEARKRFVIAHELGHFELHKNRTNINICNEESFLEHYKTSEFENEANIFAGELLMPEQILTKFDKPKGFTKLHLSNLSQIFNVSLSACALRYVEEGKMPIALVYSKNGVICWYKINKYFPFHYVETKVKVSSLSSTYDFFCTGQIISEPIEIPAEAWFANDRYFDSSLYLFEQYQVFTSFNSVLTVLWCK